MDNRDDCLKKEIKEWKVWFVEKQRKLWRNFRSKKNGEFIKKKARIKKFATLNCRFLHYIKGKD
jgi:hypothetical protein